MANGFEDHGLQGGVWRGTLRAAEQPRRMTLLHLGDEVGEAEVAPLGEGQWRVSAPLPAQRLTSGATTFHLLADGRRVAALPLLAGAPLADDLRGELALMRAEIELLKRELRRLGAAAEG